MQWVFAWVRGHTNFTRLPGKAAYLLLRIGTLAVFAALGEVTDIVRESEPLGENTIRQIEDVLELLVPRHEAWRFIEQGYTVTHILERHTQFSLALTDFIQQPSILHRDDRLGREILKQRDFLCRK